jgi:diguanylate cyclase (GGDEF)-like protein
VRTSADIGKRITTLPAFVLVAALCAVCAIVYLQQRSDSSRRAQVSLQHVGADLNELQWVPFGVVVGSKPDTIHARMTLLEERIGATIASLQAGQPVPALAGIEMRVKASFAAGNGTLSLLQMLSTTTGRSALAAALADKQSTGLPAPIREPLLQAQTADAVLLRTLGQAGRQYDARATQAKQQAMGGSAAAIALLVLAFFGAYRRSVRARADAERLAAANADLAAASRLEALTDALTGLGNRRALVLALEQVFAGGEPVGPVALALFDLDGFKQYNDSFGHPSGDALLARLGERLTETLEGIGTAYRMGGDEFCVLAPVADCEAEAIARLAAAALSEAGDAFAIGCSYGLALVPQDATSAEATLRLADQRMYEQKTSDRRSAGRQSIDVLLQVLTERSPDLEERAQGVARFAALTAEQLGIPEQEVKRIHVAAQLHDVGKSALPETILGKPGPLDAEEWEFVRQHTVIGERIVLAAPSLAHAAPLVRSSHERIDGTGYPDGLTGDAIAVGARIIAVCDAFNAMIADRPYRDRLTAEQALAELRSCAGAQFDPAIVAAFSRVVEAHGALAASPQ